MRVVFKVPFFVNGILFPKTNSKGTVVPDQYRSVLPKSAQVLDEPAKEVDEPELDLKPKAKSIK